MKAIAIGGQGIWEVDCLEGLKMLADASIAHVSTSPPYNLGGFHSDQKKRSYSGFADRMPEEQYREFIKKMIAECYRVLQITGSFFLNMKSRIADGISIPPFWVLEDNPFFLKEEIIWHYPSTANVDKVRFYPLFEHVFWFVKDIKKFTWNSEWAIIGNVWNISHIADRNETKGHPAPFPTQLSQAMILSTTNEGDAVLDPFVGSGTSLKVCRHYNRKGLGFDKYFSNYEEIARKRILSEDFPPSLLELKLKRDTRKRMFKSRDNLENWTMR